MQLMIILWCAAGMFGSYMSGYSLNHRKVQDTRIELMLEKGKVKEANARVQELRVRAHDRDTIEFGLRECLVNTTKQLDAIEDLKWQMNLVINTCPGRERPPRLPRP
jgi:hypothetical protein